MATDTEPYLVLPALYGAPAYARPPRPAPDAERPPDPDDLPIAAEQTDEERQLAAALFMNRHGGAHLAGGAAGPVHLRGAMGDGHADPGEHRLSLRALAGRLALRDR